MIGPILFSVLIFGALSSLCFFIAHYSPKGRFGKRDFDSLPGVMTPNTLKSREAWVAAHEATSSWFVLLAIYFSGAGALFMVLLFSNRPMNHQVVFGCLLLLGIFWFSILALVGDRVASRFNQKQGER